MTAAVTPAAEVLAGLGSGRTGLTPAEAARRQAMYGPNAVATHAARLGPVLRQQLRSPLLGLLLAAAAASYFVGERADAVIIGVIVALSVGLGVANEYRAEKAAEALHSRVTHRAVAVRSGLSAPVNATDLVPGDVVELRLGDIVPADLRLVAADGLECDESVLTGESLPVPKDPAPVPPDSPIAELANCALMGTVVHSGAGRGVVVATGPTSELGRISVGLAGRPVQTQFQIGLRRFSMLLVYVAAALTTSIFAINVALHRPVLDALLFSLAIAVGITPQLLPAVVSTSLAAGSREMARRGVLVKRMVCIEDLGDVDTLFTDKTGTLTEGRISFMRAVPFPSACRSDVVLRQALACVDVEMDSSGRAVAGNALDVALWNSPAAAAIPRAGRILATLPFDHERRLASVLTADDAGAVTLVTKGAPESVLARCSAVPPGAAAALERELGAGNRVVAVATRPVPAACRLTPDDERDLDALGLLVFLDPPKPEAPAALRRLAGLGITVKVLTGDSPVVATKVCQDLGLAAGRSLTGTEIDALDDGQLATAVAGATVFARVSPQQKARIVGCHRRTGADSAFLGDGVNDALALHAADVGISVDSATDVAKDAADVILLRKDLGVLADGVAEGRRIFANTMKYVLMGTSSNFGNMVSAAGASAFLSFLPMLPSQILLNNLLYDTSQLAIPTDRVDPEQQQRPSHWDIRFIRRFMFCFGPLSSIFDFLTFAVMLGPFHAGPALFRTGWFVESLATQSLVIFAIRTRRVPFFRSRPSLPLTLAVLAVVATGALLPATPLAEPLGFRPLPGAFFGALAGMVLAYLVLIEVGKWLFYRFPAAPSHRRRHPGRRHLRRRVAYFSTASARPGAP
ncbi:MAG TPA: magnesium-translocating P-type ATPase [Mycobacteriales bacterium]